MKDLGKKLIQALATVGEAIEQSNALRQDLKEKATLAHMRGEDHDEYYCGVCQATADASTAPAPKCKKHEFGECKANCRYRTGIPEDCIYAFHKNECEAKCHGRRS